MATDIKDIARQYIDAINSDDFAVLGQLIAEDFEDHPSMPGIPKGLEGVRQAHEMLRAAFPDLRFDLEESLEEGDKVVLLARGSGTNQGSFFGIPATGRRVSWIGVRCLRVKDNKVVEGWNEFDQLGILQQLGVIPSGGATG